MKIRTVVFFLGFLSCNSCSTGDKKQSVANSSIPKDTIVPPAKNVSIPKTDSLVPIKTSETTDSPIWDFDYEKELAFRIRKVSPDTLTPQRLLKIINTNEVRFDFVKIAHDTIFVKVKDSNYLTQSCGTTGAEYFLQMATFTLTELKGIKYVDIDFMEGDHCSPGTFSRKYFIDQYNSTKWYKPDSTGKIHQ
jgi:hypothetical protein